MLKSLNLAALPDSGHHVFASLKQNLTVLDADQSDSGASMPGNAYIYDLVEQHNLSGSCSVASILGYETDDVTGSKPLDLASLIHPDDLERVAEHFQRLTTLHDNEIVSIEYRMQRSDGRWCWLQSQETPLVQASDGFPLQILGIIHIIPSCRQSDQSCQPHLAMEQSG